tara:strand:- start:2456 stop:3052 length:597 start_codon:yes stop_codon:yes gene_type:complete
MANSKWKCTCCGQYYDKDQQRIKTPKGSFAGYDHIQEFVKHENAKLLFRQQTKAIKDKKKVNAKKKREFYDNDIKTRKQGAKSACHKYIRERDKNKGCICCDRPLGKSYDAGHFLESGNNSFLRYHEDNIHAQSVHCNQYKGGDSGDYEANLRLKIGDDKVDWLKANKGGVVKRTAEDYKAIEVYFKEKLKLLIKDQL